MRNSRQKSPHLVASKRGLVKYAEAVKIGNGASLRILLQQIFSSPNASERVSGKLSIEATTKHSELSFSSQKLVIFTEHRDTLSYCRTRLAAFLTYETRWL